MRDKDIVNNIFHLTTIEDVKEAMREYLRQKVGSTIPFDYVEAFQSAFIQLYRALSDASYDVEVEFGIDGCE